MKLPALTTGMLFLLLSAAVAQNPPQKPAPKAETPLTALPYTPSLDVKSMDRSVDPCQNFYMYSCGGWKKNNPIPPDQSSWDVYGKLYDENQRFLWGILDELASKTAGRNANQQKIGDYFEACMDQAKVDKLGVTPLEPVLHEIDAMTSKSQLAPLVAKLHLSTSGRGLFFGFGSNQDFGNSSQVIAFAGAGGLGLPDRDYYTKTDEKSQKIREEYLAHVQKMLELAGDAPAKAKSEADAIMKIETALAKASLTRVEMRNPYKLYHKVDFKQLEALTPDFDWSAYLKTTGMPSLNEFNVTEPGFYKELNTEIETVPLGDLKAYMRWHVLHANAAYLSSPFVDENFHFYGHILRGAQQLQPRWKRCVSLVDGQLGEALGQEFVARTFTPEMKARTVEMTKQIEAAMDRDLTQLDWMSPETKKQALIKLHGLINKVGYPDKWRDYSSVQVVRDDFLGNVERASTFETRRQLNKIGKPVDHTEWGMTPPTVNAYYDPQMNDINFPAGVLQPPLYDPKEDDAPNYGNTGSTIGHELTHGFDDEGRQFDAKGNLRDWWTPQDAAAFTKRADCVVNQYAQYTVVDNIKINSKLTEGEDVADLGGTMLAYMAWKEATKTMKLEDRDGLTPDQRFFVGMAQWACGNERPEMLRLRAMTDPHSPLQYRVNGVVSNMKQFQEAFHCKAGQPMVRENRCRVW